jgi:hypothetical protein
MECRHLVGRLGTTALVALGLAVFTPLTARAQEPAAEAPAATEQVATQALAPADSMVEPNSGRVSVTAGFDVTSSYFFRGIRQDDSGFIAWPAADLGITLHEGDAGLTSASVNFGLWNSLHSGPTGSDGPSGKLWYESDFYAGLTLGFKAASVGATYTAYTSPNDSFGTVKELGVKLAVDDSGALGAYAMAPYALVAFELDGQADGGAKEGTYLELGVGPGAELVPGRLSVSIPVKVGLSLSNYYEGVAGDSTFGYLDVGAVASVPLTFVPRSYAAWSLRAGVSWLTLGDSMKALNDGKGSTVLGYFGVGMSY